MKRSLILALFNLLIAACSLQETAQKPPPEPHPVKTQATAVTTAASIENEVQALLAQSQIDPLSHYIEAHQADALYQAAIKKLRKEREKRCAEVEKIYVVRDKDQANLKRLQKAYQYSCPHVVASFARTVATSTLTSMSAAAAPQDACADAYAKPDYAAALQFCRPLAEQGNPQAQLKLGIMYADGRGVGKNQFDAYVWFSLAVQGGIQQAQVLRNSIAKSLTTEELVQANDRVVKLSNQFQ